MEGEDLDVQHTLCHPFSRPLQLPPTRPFPKYYIKADSAGTANIRSHGSSLAIGPLVGAIYAHKASREQDDRTTATFLSGDEIEALFQLELKTELTKIVADAYLNDSYSPYVAKHARVVSESYRIAKRPDRPLKLDPDHEADLLARGFDPIEFDFI